MNATKIRPLELTRQHTRRAFAGGFAVAVILIGGAVLIGWARDIATLKSVLPGVVSMKPNTAVGFILSALAILLLLGAENRPWIVRASQVCAGAVALLGLLTLGEILFSLNLRIDLWLFHEASGTVGTLAPGRMAPTTALSFVLVAGALFLAGFRDGILAARLLALLAALIALLSGMRYFLEVVALVGFASYMQMAIHTALAFVLISAGLMLALATEPPDGKPGPAAAAQADRRKSQLGVPVFGAALWFIILVFGLLYLRAKHTERTLAICADMESIANFKAEEIARWRAERMGDAHVLAQAPLLRESVAAFLADATAGNIREALAAGFAALCTNYAYADVALFDAEGRLRLAVPAGDESAHLPQPVAHVALPGSNPELMGDLARDVGGKIHLDVMVPLVRGVKQLPGSSPGQVPAGTNLIGTVRLRIDPENFLYPLLQTWPTPSKTAETMLLQRNGDDFVFLNELRHRHGTALELRSAITHRPLPREEKAALDKGGTLEMLDYRGVAVLAAMRPIPNSPWSIVTKVDQAEVYGPMRNELWFIGLITVMLLLVATIGSILLWRLNTARMTHQMEQTEHERFLLADRLAAVVEYSDNAIFWKQLDGTIVTWNAGAERMYGYAAKEIIGRSVAVLLPPDRPNEEQLLLARVKQGERVLAYETKRQRKDQQLVDVSLTISAIRDSTGAIIGAATVADDITERKRAEVRLREQATLLDQASDAILVTKLDNRITYWNRSAERMFGWPTEQAVGRRPEDLFPDFPTDQLNEIRQTLLEHGQWNGEITLRNRAAELLHIELRASLARDAANQPIGRLLVCIDTTEKKRILEQFLRAQRLQGVGMLAAGIAHDLNNVLAPIGMISELLRAEHAGSQNAELFDTLTACTQRGAGLIKQILGFASGTGSKQNSVQVRHLLHDIEQMARETFPKSITITTAIARDLWPIHCNPTQIHQVLLNLCVNARDAMPDGGTLTLRAENCSLDAAAAAPLKGGKPGDWVVLHIMDTGTGMSAETQTRIWEPFFTTKPLDKGTGLGLSTVLGIVESHQGFILLDSKLGQGTSFRVFLPASEKSSPAATAELETAPTPGHGEGILVVDDEENVRHAIKETLSKAGYCVVTAPNGADAVALIETRAAQFALVITDCDMPVMNGTQLISWIRSGYPAIKILHNSGTIATGSCREENAEQLTDGFLQKPFTSQALLRVVEQLLHGKSNLP